LLVFAQKPAPVQVSYLGYADTTGLESIDYRFTDVHADPPESSGQFYTEELVYLAPTFLNYRPPADCPEVSPLPARQAAITFGSLNHLPKINPKTIEIWSQILRQTPSSRLIIKSLSGLEFLPTRQRILDLFAQRGIDSSRILLRPGNPRPHEHLKTYHEIDIALDTFPYNGTTTTCESLWMGVPVVTLAGRRHAGRVGVSLLTNAGLADLIARDPSHYIELATQLAGDRPRLGELRENLRDRLTRSALTDGPKFARSVEAVYRVMWRRWLRA
jgi:protein O-GlcNAc transferase